jgi:hypothetical protein
MTTYWCVNFDLEPVLNHGLADEMWLMQYQYSHGGYDLQGRRQLSATTKNWNTLRGVHAGDWLLAYMRNSTFYGVGQVIERRSRRRHQGVTHHFDTVERTTREHRHRFLNGVVSYQDALCLYEDFVDPWACDIDPPEPRQPVSWHYNQRLDVQEWQYVVYRGVQVEGLNSAAPFPLYRQAVFQIPKSFFDVAAAALKRTSL